MGMRRVRNRPEVRTSAITVAISPRAQFGNAPRVQPVFVAKGQVMQQIVDGMDALGGQHLGQAGPIPFTYWTEVAGCSI